MDHKFVWKELLTVGSESFTWLSSTPWVPGSSAWSRICNDKVCHPVTDHTLQGTQYCNDTACHPVTYHTLQGTQLMHCTMSSIMLQYDTSYHPVTDHTLQHLKYEM